MKIVLFNLDNDKTKQDKILELIPKIGASEPTKAKTKEFMP